MHWLQSIIRTGNLKPVLLVGGIFLFSILTFNILFEASTPDNYPRELLAALVGTLMAAVVTTVLLTQQSKGEELKERNVEVFRKKIAAYENFIDRAILHAGDGILDNEEAVELRRAVYSISLVSSSDTVSTLVSYVRANFVKDDDCEIGEVIAAFRKELGLDELEDTTLLDMVAIDDKVGGLIDVEQTDFTKARLTTIRDAVLDILETNSPEMFDGLERGEAFGFGDGSTILMEFRSQISYQLDLAYTAEQTAPISGIADLSSIPKAMLARVQKLVRELGFEEDADEPTVPEFLVNETSYSESGTNDEGRLIWTVQNLADTIIALERAAGSKGSKGPLRIKTPVPDTGASKI